MEKQGRNLAGQLRVDRVGNHYAIFELKDPFPGGVLNFRLVCKITPTMQLVSSVCL
jgi:hypothetical protein